MKKNKKKRDTASTVIRIFCAAAAVASAAYLLYHIAGYIIQDMENNSVQTEFEVDKFLEPTLSAEMEELLKQYESSSSSETSPDKEKTKEKEEQATPLTREEALYLYSRQSLKSYDHAGLAARNEDYRCWIDIPGTKISYPVVQSQNNTDYLTVSFDKEERRSGSIFIDANIKDIHDVQNLVIHGHNMKSGSMFGTLPSYKSISFYNNHPFVYIYTPDATMVYQIFSAYTIPANDSVLSLYQSKFPDNENYMIFLENIRKNSLYEIDTDLSPEKQILTLSTCTNQSRYRFVIHAIRYQ